MKIFVTGMRGMLGRDLAPRLREKGYALECADEHHMDITLEKEVRRIIDSCMPSLVINCAAYTAVDGAEKERDKAFAVNRDGAGLLAKVCAKIKIPMIHISTDYVFDGDKRRPYLEEDPGNPLNTYGLSKWEGEQAIRSLLEEHIIIRTSWLFGAGGQNFVKTILRQASEKHELKIVADQTGCPTWTGDLCEALTCIAGEIFRSKKEAPWGTYHFCGKGTATWYDFAVSIVEEAKKRSKIRTHRVTPIRTSDYPAAAQRPAWSVLDCSKITRAFKIYPRPWLEGLRKVMDGLLPGTYQNQDPHLPLCPNGKGVA